MRVSPDGQDITDLTSFPDVPAVLEALRGRSVRLGILSDRGPVPADRVEAALDRAGLLAFFEEPLIRFGRKDSALVFQQAAATVRADTPGEGPRLLFVGEDATERAFARSAGFLVAPHPGLAERVLDGTAPLRFLRVRVPQRGAAADWRAMLREQPLVPLHLAGNGDGAPATEVYAVADAATALALDDLGFSVDRLGEADEPLTADLYLLRDDRRAESGFGSAAGNAAGLFGGNGSAGRVLSSTEEGLLVAIPAGRSLEEFHFGGARHGHHLKLLPSPALLAPGAADAPADGFAAAGPAADGPGAAELSADERKLLVRHITADRLGRDVARYSGGEPPPGGAAIDSRHILHPGNASAVRALIEDVTAIGGGLLTVGTHRFVHEGRPLENVEAVLPGTGVPGVVLVTAHMDSTGARQAGYRAPVDPAPGADDDGSGVAGVLGALRAVVALAGADHAHRREIRFVFFNAEEHGLVGSRAYAGEQARLGADIRAVFQLDMIGFDTAAPSAFELHAGFSPSPAVQTRSRQIAELIAALAPQVSPGLPAPQIFAGANGTGDPAEGRSDHYSFQLHGYPACLASEDFFAGPGPSAPAPEPNPDYHLPADRTVNAGYAADIARATAAAAWLTVSR
ncbi:M20/M25/M40 family metallo-hydrolase [Kitasatospora sp. KL5]|uniref:M28 family metallopeptidase n=1 Tax=Kitasatospora sp. KL5 TaxID=3425125 RepID=UPI003D6FAF23